jgi:hypothetical protein
MYVCDVSSVVGVHTCVHACMCLRECLATLVRQGLIRAGWHTSFTGVLACCGRGARSPCQDPWGRTAARAPGRLHHCTAAGQGGSPPRPPGRGGGSRGMSRHRRTQSRPARSAAQATFATAGHRATWPKRSRTYLTRPLLVPAIPTRVHGPPGGGAATKAALRPRRFQFAALTHSAATEAARLSRRDCPAAQRAGGVPSAASTCCDARLHGYVPGWEGVEDV